MRLRSKENPYRKLVLVAAGVYRVDPLQDRERFGGLALRHQEFGTFGVRESDHGNGECRQAEGAEEYPPGVVADAVEFEGYRQRYDDPRQTCERVSGSAWMNQRSLKFSFAFSRGAIIRTMQTACSRDSSDRGK